MGAICPDSMARARQAINLLASVTRQLIYLVSRLSAGNVDHPYTVGSLPPRLDSEIFFGILEEIKRTRNLRLGVSLRLPVQLSLPRRPTFESS